MKKENFSQIGTRENNEDFLGHNEHCIVVCDGIGGHASGEVASKYIVDFVLLNSKDQQEEFTKSSIQELLLAAQNGLNNMLDDKPHLAKMGTTFTGLFFSENACFAAHIGDSRIYLIRPAEKKIWHTWDHSLVGELVKNKDITHEAGRHHPMGNRISKALMANEKGKTAKADILKLDQLQKGDLFLLCSDGVNEAWPEHELVELLCNTSLNIQQKTDVIKDKCSKLSKDNNTVYLVEIEEPDEMSFGSNEEVKWINLQEFYDDFDLHKKKIAEEEAEAEEEEIEAEIISSPIVEPIRNTESNQQTNNNQHQGNNSIDLNQPAQKNDTYIDKQRKNTNTSAFKNLLQKRFIWLLLIAIAAILILFKLSGEEEGNEKLEEIIITKSVTKDNKGQHKTDRIKKAENARKEELKNHKASEEEAKDLKEEADSAEYKTETDSELEEGGTLNTIIPPINTDENNEIDPNTTDDPNKITEIITVSPNTTDTKKTEDEKEIDKDKKK